MKVRVIVDKNNCIGSGSCVITDPEDFTLNADGKAEVTSSHQVLEVDASQLKKLLSAANACPVQAIGVFDEKGNKLS